MFNKKTCSLFTISTLILTLLTQGGFADTPQYSYENNRFQPHFQVIVNNQLSQDIIATFSPTSYSLADWDGICSDQVLHGLNKKLCEDKPELVQGIPANLILGPQLSADNPYIPGIASPMAWDIPIMKFFDMPDGKVGFSVANAFQQKANALLPFAGDIVIKNLGDGKEIAKIHYELQVHQATTYTRFERSTVKRIIDNSKKPPLDEGRYLQWAPLTASHDPSIDVNIVENYPTGYGWCWLFEDVNSENNTGFITTPCSSTPTITLSIHNK